MTGRVTHPIYGSGTVASHDPDGELLVLVAFDDTRLTTALWVEKEDLDEIPET